MRLNDPILLLLALVLVPMVLYYLFGPKSAVKFSSIDPLARLRPSWTLWARHVLFLLRCGAVLLIVIALARPQKGREELRDLTKGIDIELLMDCSSSMAGEDLEQRRSQRNKIIKEEGKRPSRLYFAKKVVADFIKARRGDRIGMIVFARYAYTQCPLTLDYDILQEFLDILKPMNPYMEPDPRLREQIAAEDGTAIGAAIATGVLRLHDSKARSKVMILLTDGRNNQFATDPDTATELARAEGIKIYTIGVGTDAEATPVPRLDAFGNVALGWQRFDLDERALKQIAQRSGGKYFRATDATALASIYETIDKMEKTEVEVKRYVDYTEAFIIFLLPALGLILVETLLANTRFRKIP